MTVLRKISNTELNNIIQQNKLWHSSNKEKGKRADLSSVYLGSIRLIKEDLIGIDFSKSDLRYSDLRDADLELSILSETNLELADLRGSNLSFCTFENANLQKADLRGARLIAANLSGANLRGADLRGAFLTAVSLKDVDLEGAKYDIKELSKSVDIDAKWLKREVDDRRVTNKEIESLRTENNNLTLRAKRLEKERRQGQINEEEYKTQNKELENKNRELHQRLLEAEEKARREITKENIDKAIDALKNPNTYIRRQIQIQNVLAIAYGVLVLASFMGVFWYIKTKYSVFSSLDLTTASIISWLFYVSPILLLGSLGVTLMNQINHRLKRILVLNERKRYVEAMGGALKATVELSETDADAREKIEGYMDTIVKNTISRKIDVLNLEESESDEVKSLEILDKIKSLLKE